MDEFWDEMEALMAFSGLGCMAESDTIEVWLLPDVER